MKHQRHEHDLKVRKDALIGSFNMLTEKKSEQETQSATSTESLADFRKPKILTEVGFDNKQLEESKRTWCKTNIKDNNIR